MREKRGGERNVSSMDEPCLGEGKVKVKSMFEETRLFISV